MKKRQQRIQTVLDSCAIAYELIDITESGCEDERKFMQETAKAKDGDRNPLPPQIFNNKDYCGVSIPSINNEKSHVHRSCVTMVTCCLRHMKLYLPQKYKCIQGWNFGRFLVLLGFTRLYSLSGKYSPSIPFPSEPEIPGTQSTRLRPQFHTESLIGKPKILKRQTHGITTKAYRSV